MDDPTELTHLDAQGNARMVDISEKTVTARQAIAAGRVRMQSATLAAIRAGTMKKGDVLAVARIAGIQAAKETSRLIPLCHQIALSAVNIDFTMDDTLPGIVIQASAQAIDRTGAEMEALVAVSIAALTIYDMTKAVDRAMIIEAIQLEHKSGGKSGD